MYKKDLALNNLQWLMCHKTKPNQAKPNASQMMSIFLLHPVYIKRHQIFLNNLYNKNNI